MKRVIVHIDQLVLSGFRHEDRHAFVLGLQQELGRVFGDRDAVQQLIAVGDVSRLQVSGVHIEHGLKPEGIGENVAQGIGKDMRK